MRYVLLFRQAPPVTNTAYPQKLNLSYPPSAYGLFRKTFLKKTKRTSAPKRLGFSVTNSPSFYQLSARFLLSNYQRTLPNRLRLKPSRLLAPVVSYVASQYPVTSLFLLKTYRQLILAQVFFSKVAIFSLSQPRRASGTLPTTRVRSAVGRTPSALGAWSLVSTLL